MVGTHTILLVKFHGTTYGTYKFIKKNNPVKDPIEIRLSKLFSSFQDISWMNWNKGTN